MNIITDDKSITKQIIKTIRKCRGKKVVYKSTNFYFTPYINVLNYVK